MEVMRVAVVRNVAYANAPAYQGSGLEKSAPAASAPKSSEPVVREAPEVTVAGAGRGSHRDSGEAEQQ